MYIYPPELAGLQKIMFFVYFHLSLSLSLCLYLYIYIFILAISHLLPCPDCALLAHSNIMLVRLHYVVFFACVICLFLMCVMCLVLVCVL